LLLQGTALHITEETIEKISDVGFRMSDLSQKSENLLILKRKFGEAKSEGFQEASRRVGIAQNATVAAPTR